MNNKIKNGSFVAISDFHSNRWPLDEKIPKYLRQYDIIYILGDATDRGKDDYGNQLEGKGGVKLLLDIMDLCKKYPSRVIYIPGNHDEFLYYYAAHKNTNLGIFMRDNLSINGGYHTKADIDDLRQNNPQRLKELISWLGNLPVQRTHIYNSQRYYLAHAFFNQRIYQKNPSYSLEDMYQDNSKSEYNINNEQSQILWFRKNDRYMNYDSSSVPSEGIIVIGHTPEQVRNGENLDLINSKGMITPVKCVDGGLTYFANEEKMLKYVSGDSDAIHTSRVQESYEGRKKNTENTPTSNEIEIFMNAMIATANKYGIKQVRGIIVKLIYKNHPHWFLSITNDNNHRSYVQNMNLLKVKNIIESYSPFNEKNPYILAENFINALLKIIEEYRKNITENESSTQTNFFEPEIEEIDLSNQSEKTIQDNDVSKESSEQFNIEQYIIKKFEEEKAKILKARFSDEQKKKLIEELKQEYEGITGSSKVGKERKNKN